MHENFFHHLTIEKFVGLICQFYEQGARITRIGQYA